LSPTSTPDPCYIVADAPTTNYGIQFNVPDVCTGRLLLLNTVFNFTESTFFISILFSAPNQTSFPILHSTNCTQPNDLFNITWDSNLNNTPIDSCPLSGPYSLSPDSSNYMVASQGIWTLIIVDQTSGRFNIPPVAITSVSLHAYGTPITTVSPPVTGTTTDAVTSTLSSATASNTQSGQDDDSDDTTVIVVVVVVVCVLALSGIAYAIYRTGKTRRAGF
jgi:hypothetical protein